MLTMFRDQPRPFYMIFMLEIWERFGYYTVQGILVLYFIRFLGYSDEVAYESFGAFFALVYAMVALGGYLGDKILGTKRTLIAGLIVLAGGYLALALTNHKYVFFALSLICVGNGLFKANPANLLAKCYAQNELVLHAGFTLYYMAINLGAIAALFAGPWISSQYGYAYAYFTSFIGILLGLANYWFQRHQVAAIHTTADQNKIDIWQWLLMSLGLILLIMTATFLLQHVFVAKKLLALVASILVLIYFFYMYKQNKTAHLRMLLAFFLMIEAVAFFTLYQQMPTSINLFAVNNVHPTLWGIAINPQSFQVLNPIWIITLSPVLAWFYTYLHQRNIEFSIPYKFALGMTCCGLSFFVLYLARYVHDDMGLVSAGWLIGSYLFQALGELLVSALGVAMVAELVPPSMVGFVMGMWYLTSSVAGFTGAKVAKFTALPQELSPGVESLMVYTHVFAYISVITLGFSLILWLISPYLQQLIKKS